MGKYDDRFLKIYRQGNGFRSKIIEIWVDRMTGVNYIWASEGYAGGLTPLLNRDGTPVITPISAVENR